jgi:hypothetical protein
MRHIVIAAALVLLAACSAGNHDIVRVTDPSSTASKVIYYDRNSDGVADLELHQPPHCDDCDWALVDTDFNGRYDKRVRWSFGILKEPIDVPVTDNVPLAGGEPPLSGWND